MVVNAFFCAKYKCSKRPIVQCMRNGKIVLEMLSNTCPEFDCEQEHDQENI